MSHDGQWPRRQRAEDQGFSGYQIVKDGEDGGRRTKIRIIDKPEVAVEAGGAGVTAVWQLVQSLTVDHCRTAPAIS